MKEITLARYKGNKLLSLSLVALAIFLIATLFNQRIQADEMQEKLSEYETQIEIQQYSNDKIRSSMEDNIYDKENFAEQYAREEFGYAVEGEKVFVNIGGN